jgi:hypothetical protein
MMERKQQHHNQHQRKAVKDFDAMKDAVAKDPKLLTTIVAQYELSAIQLDDLQTLISK